MTPPTIRARVPETAKAGEVVTIRALIRHPMENGFRRDATGQVVPRHIITAFSCTYAGEEVFRAELFPAIAADPYLEFRTVATQSGDIVLRWFDENGEVYVHRAKITVA